MTTTTYTPGNETVLTIKDDRLMVELADIGEGTHGDYDPSDPDDMPLIRFYVYERADDPDYEDGWRPVEDASRCTAIPLDTSREKLEAIAKVIFGEFEDALPTEETGASIKAIADRLSWLDDTDGEV